MHGRCMSPKSVVRFWDNDMLGRCMSPKSVVRFWDNDMLADVGPHDVQSRHHRPA